MTSNINYSTGDELTQLPFDKSIPTHNEILIVDNLFKQKQNLFNKILEKSKDLVILAILFIIFSLPQFDFFLNKFIPSTNNSLYILIGAKAFLFIFTYFLTQNIHLVRK